MFSLIITIISIALVAALAVATIYYGGSAFTQGTAKANASALVGASQQITGANTLHYNDKSANAADIQALVTDGYLQAVPTAPANVTLLALSSTTGEVTASVSSDAVCKAIVSSIASGVSTIGAAQDSTRQYDCFGTAAPYSFVFKG